MIWRKVEEQETVHHLDSERTCAGAVIGDNWVTTAIAHVDCLGAICVIRWKSEPIDIKRGHVPSVREVTAALGKAWGAMWGRDPVQYSRFFLSLPAWCCRSKEVARDIDIRPRGRFAMFKRNIVAAAHIRQVEDTILAEDISPQHAVVEFLHHCHVLDGSSRMSDAVGSVADRFGIESHVVMADLHIVRELLDYLRDMGIYVDEMISPFTASAEGLSQEERECGAASLQIGRRFVSCSFFSNGNLVRTACLKCGSDDVTACAADELDVSISDLSSYVNERKAILYSQEAKLTALPLFRWHATHPVLRKLDDAAVKPAESLYNEIKRCMDSACADLRFRISHVGMTGDDYLVMRVLRDLIAEGSGIPCRWDIPEKVHGIDVNSMPGFAGMVGMMRSCGMTSAAPRRQAFLESYNDSFMNLFIRRISTRAVAAASTIGRKGQRNRMGPRTFNSIMPTASVLRVFGKSNYVKKVG